MTTEREDMIIRNVQQMQEKGFMLCPRCGQFMRRPIEHNALSRHAQGCYICGPCGTAEALQDVYGVPDSVEDWVIARCYHEEENV